MDQEDWTLDHLSRAWQELATVKGVTPEQAEYEYLRQASEAMTVNGKGEPIPDEATRGVAKQLMAKSQMLHFFGMKTKVDKSIPPNEIRVVDIKTGRVIGVIANVGSVKGDRQ